MTTSHHDVVVLGADLAPLTCAALLAKRGFRVLVLGQGGLTPTYRLADHVLPRRPFVFTAHGTPVAERILSELGLQQSVRRLTHPVDPAFQLVMPGHRLDVTPDPELLDRELEREFPRVKRPVMDFHDRATQMSKALDGLFERDLVWPPETLWERRQVARATAKLPLVRDAPTPDILAELPEEHPFRASALAVGAFASDADAWPPATLASARLYANAHRRPAGMERGLAALTEMWIERLHAHSGTLRMGERAEAISVSRSGVDGVTLAGSGEEISAGFVVAGIDVAALMRILPDRAPFEALFDRYGEPQIRLYRYTLNAILRRGGLPQAMARDVFRVGDARAAAGIEDALHLQRTPLDEKHELVTMQALLPSRRVENDRGYLDGSRERLLAVLADLVPFVGDSLVLVDSPHDGRPPLSLGRTSALPLALEPGDRRGPHTMQALHAFPVWSHSGLCALPVRTPIRKLLLCNTQVMPALGMEGQLLAGSSAARIIAGADRSREWMRRRPWSRVRI